MATTEITQEELERAERETVSRRVLTDEEVEVLRWRYRRITEHLESLLEETRDMWDTLGIKD